MVAGLVSVDVATHEAISSDVFVISIILLWQMHREQAVEAVKKPFFASHHLDEPSNVVRYME